MVKFVDRVKLNLSTTGTGTVTFGSVVDGFQSLADASVVDADVVRYAIESGTNYEVGTGTIGLAGGTYTMARSPSSSSESDNSAINLGAGAVCFLTMLAEDVVQYLADLDNVSSTSPAGGQTLSWNAGTSSWSPASPSGGITTVGNYAGLPASPSETDLAWVQDTKSLYIYDGTEWDRVNSGSDALPEITTVLPAALNFQPSSANVVTIAANDPDGFPLTYDYDTNPADVSSIVSSVNNANNGTFTINTTSVPGSFSFRAKVNDGVHTSITTSTVTIIPTTPIINSISPALPGGETSWNFDVDGSEINLDAGETYTFTAAGQFALDFEVFGAGGGSTNYAYGSYKGGGGGRTTGRTTLAYNQTYTLVVGGKGREGGTVPSGGSQGSGGDGGGSQTYSNAGGGDLSGFFKGSGDIATFAAQGHGSSSHTPIAIAGGGGGSGSNADGGIGGGTSGGVYSPQSGTSAAGVGSQTAGGVGGIASTQNGSDGSYLIGGAGGVTTGSYTGSGGGGGYFGGGGGGYRNSQYIQGAAGGSGYFNTSLVTSGVLTDGDTTSVALNYLDGSSQTSGKGAQNGSDNGTDGRVKLTKVT